MFLSLTCVVIISYLIGSIPSGFILSKILFGKDPRNTGSGNIGATNITRIGGAFAGLIVLIFDVAKGYIPVYFTLKYNIHYQAPLFAGLSALLGHIFPIYLKFKGGKGVATSIGIFSALIPSALLIDGIIFLIVFFIWRYVSLASIISAISLPGIIKFLMMFNFYQFNDNIIYFATTVAMIIIYTHRANIERLIKKQEQKFGNKDKIIK